MASQSRRIGAYTEQKSADRYAGEITAIFESFLIPDIPDKAWLIMQDRLSRVILRIMRERKKNKKA